MKSFVLFISSAFLALFLQIDPVKSEEIVIKNIRYLKPEIFEWSDPSDMFISRGKIKFISSHQKKGHNLEVEDKVRYVIPSFCDSYVTLGSDSLGFQNNFANIKKALLSFLYHGFTKIHVIGDGHWVRAVKDEIDKGKILGPEIVMSERPIIIKSPETENLSEQLYFVAKDQNSLESEVATQIKRKAKFLNIFHRFHKDTTFNYDAKILNKIVKLARSENKEILLSAFADRQSIIESLSAGVTAIAHPIGAEVQPDFPPLYQNALKWIPLFNVYRFQKNQGRDELKKDLQYMKEKSRFFRSNYAELMEKALGANSLSGEDQIAANKEYESYMSFFGSNQPLAEKMILGSGSGNLFSFPGISGLMELKIIHEVTLDMKSVLKIATENSCSFLSSEKEGFIREGVKANLIVLNDSPFSEFDNLFGIQEVYKDGRKVVSEMKKEFKSSKRKTNKEVPNGKKKK